MQKKQRDELYYIFANLMVFYKGAITRDHLLTMTIPEIIFWNEQAERMVKAQERELKKNGK